MNQQPGQDDKRLQDDDTTREEQRSHGSEQNRTKKDGHTDQIGTGQGQTSQRQRGAGARRHP